MNQQEIYHKEMYIYYEDIHINYIIYNFFYKVSCLRSLFSF